MQDSDSHEVSSRFIRIERLCKKACLRLARLADRAQNVRPLRVVFNESCSKIQTGPRCLMQIIERRRNQAIVIDGHIRVTVLEVHDDEITVSVESDTDPQINCIETIHVVSEAAELELAGALV